MDKTKKIVSLLLMTLFMSYYAGTTLFSHLHTISGATIVHSHIHTNSHHNTKSGGHTNQSVTFIAQISQFEGIDFLCAYVPVPFQFLLHKDKFVDTTYWAISIHLQNLSLRAPPIV